MPVAMQNEIQTAPSPVANPPAKASKQADRNIIALIVLFVLGCASQDYTILDIGKYSILLIYVAAIPFCARVTSRALGFLVLPLLSTLLSATVSVVSGVPVMGVVSQGALQLLAIFLAAGVATLDWRRFFMPFSQTWIVIGTPMLLFSGYQMFARAYRWKYAFLPVTNQQAYALAGLQRGWEKEPFTRASAFFAEPSELGYYCLWLLIIGLSIGKGKWRIMALALAFAGMLFSQSLSAALGAGLLFLVYILINPISLKLIRQVAIVVIASVMAILAVIPLLPEAFDKFETRIEQALSFDNRADSGRVDHLPANWELYKDSPIWGHGLASISTADDNGTDVTTFTYLLLLIERGLIGTIFFMAPWVWIGYRSLKLPMTEALRTPCLLLSALNLFTFAYSSLAYTLTYWLALGICASVVLKSYLPATHFGISFAEAAAEPQTSAQR